MAEFRIIATNCAVYTNKKLNDATARIMKAADSMEKSAYRIAAIIAEVARNEYWKGETDEDGKEFKSVHDWTESAFGIKKSMSYALLKIGNDFLIEIIDENGKKIGISTRLRNGNVNDYSTSQLFQLTSVPMETLIEWNNEGIIAPEMSCRELAAVVKKWKDARKQPKLENKGESTNEGGEEGTATPNAQTTATAYATLLEVKRLYSSAVAKLTTLPADDEKNVELLTFAREVLAKFDDLVHGTEQ